MTQTMVKIPHNYIILHPGLYGVRYLNITNGNLGTADKEWIYQCLITISTINKYTKASCDKPYNITVMPTAPFNTFCNIMTV